MAEIKVYGKPWCIETRGLLRLLNYNDLDYDYTEITRSADIPEELKEKPGIVYKDGMIETPVVEYNSQYLSAPGFAVLRRMLDLESAPGPEFFDVIVIGGGITGMLTAIDAASSGLKCALLEQSTLGGNLLRVDAFSHPVLSPVWKPSTMMIDQLQEQMLKLGVEVILASKVSGIGKEKRIFSIKSLHKTYKALSVIITTGRKRIYPQLQNADRIPPEYIIYNPVYADGIWKGKNTAIYAGDTESLAFAYRLSRSAREVHVLLPGNLDSDDLLQRELKSGAFTALYEDINRIMLEGMNRLESINITTGNREKAIECEYLFVFPGLAESGKFLDNIPGEKKNGYIITDDNLNVKGVKGLIAAGECRLRAIGAYLDIAAESSMAAYAAYNHIKNL